MPERLVVGLVPVLYAWWGMGCSRHGLGPRSEKGGDRGQRRSFSLLFRPSDFGSGREQGGCRSHNEYRTVSAAVGTELEDSCAATRQEGIIVGTSVFDLQCRSGRIILMLPL